MFDPASRMGSVEVPGTKLMRAEKQPLDRMALSWCLGGFDKSMVNLWLIYGSSMDCCMVLLPRKPRYKFN